MVRALWYKPKHCDNKNQKRMADGRKPFSTLGSKIPKQIMQGRISVFGGPHDSGMHHGEGLALFEHHEADLRPDLFMPRASDKTEGTSKRLKCNALYFAYRFPKAFNRKGLQSSIFWFINPKNGLTLPLSLVDYGPHEDTRRTFDISPYAAELLKVQTDDELECLNL